MYILKGLNMGLEQWKADRLMKQTKKKARKALEKQGHHRKTAAKLVNAALKRIAKQAEENEDND
jgi:predicted DNA-binding protein (UPF0251 family)